ncbi:XRE family transcriptional regulator [uncultured Eubacterium sp.]|uniref:helix-turn-helix domain-containing protein n=1 Tax=uncultured Eubacterium sp. TaxID=165185 RepID=UPI00259399D1|nr:XRE family transcriptional regulator [uncultured Eubacterium sp.]
MIDEKAYIRKFNGNRLKEAMLFRKINMTELSEMTGIKKQSLSLYVHNSNNPTFDKVIKISRELGFPVDYFMSEDNCDVESGTTFFRSYASATKKERISQKIKLEYVAKMYKVLLKYVNFPEINIPVVEDNYISYNVKNIDTEEQYYKIDKLAKEIREYWDIGLEPIRNLKYLLEFNGIIVTGFDDVNNKIDAFSQKIVVEGKKTYIIALALGDKSMQRLNFDMAHELGHILLHSSLNDIEKLSREELVIIEKQANRFASSFLLPQDTFYKSVLAYPTNIDYYKVIKKKWKVSMQAMMYRAKDLKIVTENQFQYMMRIVSKRGWRIHEPEDEDGKIEDSIFQGAIDLLVEEKYFSTDELLKEFANHGIILAQNDMENIMCLRKGTLKLNTKIVPFISIKKDN